MTDHRSATATQPLVGEGDHDDHPLRGDTPRTFGDQPVVETAKWLRVPALGFGTWQLDDDEAREMTRLALEIGVRHIDTAQMYENETGVGAGIAEAGIDRADVFLTTKIADEHHAPSALVRSVEASLDRLGTDHVDLVLLHWPVRWDRIGATLAAMVSVQAAGLAHRIGVSNFTVEQLDEVVELAPLEVLQVECHPFLQQNELRAWCERHDWVFTAYSPLAQGEVFDHDVLCDIAAAHDTDAAAVALAWLLQLPGVAAIPRTGDPDHLRANWAARDLTLTDDEIGRIGEIAEERRLIDPDRAPW